MKEIRYLVVIQSGYLLITALWPLIDIESFMLVTGRKEDIWLVKTVAALLIPVALCLGTYLLTGGSYLYPMVLGSLIPIAFMSIDFIYAGRDVISDIYLIDGVIQVIFFASWIVLWIRNPVPRRTFLVREYIRFSSQRVDHKPASTFPGVTQRSSGIISTYLHGILDYVVSIFLIAMPSLLGLSHYDAATWVPVAVGTAAIVYSLFTDYEWGIVSVISLRAHLSLDLVAGFILGASPWVFGFAEDIYIPHLVAGILSIVIAVLTRSSAETSEEALLRILRRQTRRHQY